MKEFLTDLLAPDNHNLEESVNEVSNGLDLTSAELDLLLKIRSGDFKEIIVQTKNGDISKITQTQLHDPKSRIVDLLRLDKYQTVAVETKDGKIRNIKRQSHHRYE